MEGHPGIRPISAQRGARPRGGGQGEQAERMRPSSRRHTESADMLRLSEGGSAHGSKRASGRGTDEIFSHASTRTGGSGGRVSDRGSQIKDWLSGPGSARSGGGGSRGGAERPRSAASGENRTGASGAAGNGGGGMPQGLGGGSILKSKNGGLPLGGIASGGQGQRDSGIMDIGTSALAKEEKDLIDKRLKERYGFGMSKRESDCIEQMQSNGKGISFSKDGKMKLPEGAHHKAIFETRMVIGKETTAVKVLPTAQPIIPSLDDLAPYAGSRVTRRHH